MRFHRKQEPEKNLLDRIFTEETPSRNGEEGSEAANEETAFAVSSDSGTIERPEETAAVSPGNPSFPEPKNEESETASNGIASGNAAEGFLDSLENINPDDIAPEPGDGKKKNRSAGSLLRSMLVFVSVCVFAGCLVYLGSRCYYYYKSYVTYRDLEKFISTELSALPMKSARQEQLPKASPDYEASKSLSENEIEEYRNIAPVVPYSDEFETALVRLTLLKQKNSDFFGYLSIPDTAINYQVVKGEDNDYYLDHDFIRSYDPAGAIFVDYRCGNSLKTNLNTTFYGHHMTGGSTMFHDLDKFADENFFQSHPFFTVTTFEGVFTYEVFSVYETTRYYNYIHYAFQSDAEFLAFCNEMKNNSLFVREGMAEFTPDDRILTFSTCTNVSGDGRLCMQARLVSIET